MSRNPCWNMSETTVLMLLMHHSITLFPFDCFMSHMYDIELLESPKLLVMFDETQWLTSTELPNVQTNSRFPHFAPAASPVGVRPQQSEDHATSLSKLSQDMISFLFCKPSSLIRRLDPRLVTHQQTFELHFSHQAISTGWLPTSRTLPLSV
jgi:hypothetical protein